MICFQIIYMLANTGQDYCRETIYAEDEESARKEAESLRSLYEHLHPPLTFRLEQW